MIGKDLNLAKSLLERGKLVAIPTETVYGLAANAFDEKAVSEIFRVKNRPSFDPLIVHVGRWEQVFDFVKEIPEQAQKLASLFMPGPLTLVLPKTERLPDIVTAGSPQVAVRIPNHPLTQELLHSIGFPLAAPSANPFGYISPTTAQHVADQLEDQVPYILDGGPCTVGIESTIIGFEDGAPTVYRKGGLTIESIESVIGPVAIKTYNYDHPLAPGMLQSHYAPKIPLKIGQLPELLSDFNPNRIGLLVFRRPVAGIPEKQQVVLSKNGDFAEAARNLFAGLRYLDGLDLDLILAEPVPEMGLGRAINDRLKRAAAVEG
ncbi:MAG: threonylcarbamoyl-AMP synthase [Saprospirales bacterium]|nr:threonylcarbamoyl-AMP synthase [Saprospirales bacterium]